VLYLTAVIVQQLLFSFWTTESESTCGVDVVCERDCEFDVTKESFQSEVLIILFFQDLPFGVTSEEEMRHRFL